MTLLWMFRSVCVLVLKQEIQVVLIGCFGVKGDPYFLQGAVWDIRKLKQLRAVDHDRDMMISKKLGLAQDVGVADPEPREYLRVIHINLMASLKNYLNTIAEILYEPRHGFRSVFLRA